MDKYSRNNLKNLQQKFTTPFSHKQNTISGFYIALLKCAWNVENFQKKGEYASLIIFEIIDPGRRGYLNL